MKKEKDYIYMGIRSRKGTRLVKINRKKYNEVLERQKQK